jgi:hypothetical protein
LKKKVVFCILLVYVLLDKFSTACVEGIIDVIAKSSRIPGPICVAEVSFHIRLGV